MGKGKLSLEYQDADGKEKLSLHGQEAVGKGKLSLEDQDADGKEKLSLDGQEAGEGEGSFH